ncbi:MAG: type I DNA topoisomerase [Clostridia bacterium]|nr:type I DNA topoisomerase [Clostridia bacterium]
MQLIIVESPSKAKTIEKYLGGKYKVDASGGHVRDLPEKRLGVNIAKNYEPNYVISADKKPVIKRLKEKVEKADKIYLATDPDREGEAISWHLQEVLGLKDKAQRIEFNEISEKAVKEALKNPREINYNLVDSQQARRVLDRLVGYKLSPLLCKRIQNGLSAGRVQSVALRIIVDKEREIRAFVPAEYWNLTATLSDGHHKPFTAYLAEKDGKKFKPANQAEADEVENAIKAANGAFAVKQVKKTDTKSHALPPFTTSTMQQDASAKLNMSSPMCMQVAQHLYEGIETQEGHLALVTYIRTDSVRISAESQARAREYIAEKYGDEYVPEKPNFYKSKKNAQDAHEAIRPIDLSMTPEKVKPLLDRNHYNLYKLIYERFIASQMSEAKYNYVTIDSVCGDYTFRTNGRTVVFKGYTAVYDDYKANQETEDGEIVKVIPPVKEGDGLKAENVSKEQKFTKPPVRFTDASLVRIMEEKGIGRPSTYATIISVLSKRKYTVKENKYIVPTEIAFRITDMLVKYFPDIMDVSFTAGMEDKLDDIEKGGQDWHKIIADFYPPFAEKLAFAATDGDEITDIVCEKCGAPMIRKNGRYGKFLACSNYPECSNIKSEKEEVSDVKCDKCGAMMVYKTGKYGRFLACPNYPECTNVKPIDEETTTEKCEKCGGDMVVKKGRFGKYLQCTVCKATKSLTEKAGVCPQCGNPTQKMTSKSGKIFYGCSNYPACNFMSWDMPTGEHCPKCGSYIVLTKDGKTRKCSNKECDYSDKPKKTKKADKTAETTKAE